MATVQVDERFVEAVESMRCLVRRYYAGEKDLLQKCKTAEALVDRWLASIHNPDLFGTEDVKFPNVP